MAKTFSLKQKVCFKTNMFSFEAIFNTRWATYFSRKKFWACFQLDPILWQK